MRITIRIISFIAALTAPICAYLFNIFPLYFASIAFLLTFLGTFIVQKPSASKEGHTVTQTGGHFSKNTQTVNFGSVEKKQDGDA